jgi:DNA modification methylase
MVNNPALHLRVEPRSIDAIKLARGNPRLHRPLQIKQIARSIQTFGFVVPILIDRNDTIIAGHGRWQAARQLGMKDVPVIKLEKLSETQVAAFRIADNRLAETSDWDDAILAETLEALADSELEFDLDVIGFSMAEIDLRIEAAVGTDTQDPLDQIPDPPAPAAVSKVADLWRLGDHLLLCGDALSAMSYARLMAGLRADIVFTDPPYNKRIHGEVSGNGKIKHREFVMGSGELTPDEFVCFLEKSCGLMARHSVDGAIHFLCMDWAHTYEMLRAGQRTYSELKNICVWVKNNGGLGSLYRSRHELVFVFKTGTGKHRNNVELGRHGRNRTNVWEYPAVHGFGRSGDEGNLLELHPTVKPVRLIAEALLDCSARGDLVLDPFLGSGSTLMAAERTGRICRAIELDPLYVDVAIRRWQSYTGDVALHADTGVRFDDQVEEVSHGK